MRFEDYCKQHGIVLKTWQKMAARGLINIMGLHCKPGQGKTFLMHLLSRFVEEHGNNLEL